VQNGGYVQKNNTFTLLLHNTLWRDDCGQIVRELDEAELFGFSLNTLPLVERLVLTLCA